MPLAAFGLLLAALLPVHSVAQEGEAAPATPVDEAPEDPDPAALARASAAHVASLPAFAFSWFISYDEVIDGREKLTFLRSGRNVMRRGEGFASYAESGNRRRDYFHDGSVFTISAPEEGFYASVPFEGTFEALVDAARERSGSVLPLWALMSADLPDRFAPDDGGTAAAYVGETRIAGTPVHHLSFASDDEDWQLWVATDDAAPLPLMLVGTRLNELGWPQYRVYLTDWDTEPETGADSFTFVPGEDDRPVAMPSLAARPSDAAGAAEAEGE
ncbi:MAG: DUF2092 domain-containing protein [Pseudomonadota bacterium]